jgi:O-6-methylguanine DNA methyltransferase
MRRLNFHRWPSPVGELSLVWDEEGLRALDFEDYDARLERLLTRHYGAFTMEPAEPPTWLTGPLEAYFAGDIRALEGLPVATGGSAFQEKVWAALREIPAGETWSYGRLAAHVGQPKASRAVGLANGANPVGIVTPCHRVIGADATLTGYGGGLERKRWLLEHEGVALAPERRRASKTPEAQLTFALAPTGAATGEAVAPLSVD